MFLFVELDSIKKTTNVSNVVKTANPAQVKIADFVPQDTS